MRIADVLIIAGCLGAGYWIVSSIMGPGIDVMKAGRESGAKPDAAAPRARDAHAKALPRTHSPERDWHLILDVPRDATRRDIQAALKRRLATATDNRDTAEMDRVRQAAEFAMRAARSG